jgi:glycosyltransferase involved in cell wall biosynthesis
MRAAYRSSHFLLHTSWTEGLPKVLIEAFAAVLPVVATDVGGIREAVGGGDPSPSRRRERCGGRAPASGR